jgi:hypothetical protein
MSGMRRRNQTTNIEFKYVIRNFIALETEYKEDEDKKFEEWSSKYLGSLLETSIDSIDFRNLSKKYEGKISIALEKLEKGSVIVGQDLRAKFQPYKSSGHGPLCNGVFKVKISLKGIDGKAILGLHALLKRARINSWNELFQEFYNLTKKLGRIPAECQNDTPITKNIQNYFDRAKAFSLPLLEAFGIDSVPNDEVNPKEVSDFLENLTRFLNRSDIRGTQFRGQLGTYLEMYKELIKLPISILRDKKFDVDSVEKLGTDIFQIFRHCMNLIIRYFKYDKQQFWLQEIPDSYSGYFYVMNEVSFNGKSPLIPIARHHHTSEFLSEDYMILESDWNDIKDELSNYEFLVKSSGDFTLGGIFSQSDSLLEADYLENAVILCVVGLEAAMTQTLEYFYGEEGANGTAGVKLRRLEKFLNNILFPLASRDELKSVFGLISMKTEKIEDKGLLQWRNDIIHNQVSIPKNLKKRIVKLISVGRRFAYQLLNWIESEPDKQVAIQKDRQQKRRVKPKTRR